MLNKIALLIGIIFVVFYSSAQATEASWDYNKDSWTEIMLAAYEGDIKKIEILIESGKDINEQIHGGNLYTALDVGIWTQNYEVVEYLLNQGANVNGQDNSTRTPLVLASRFKSVKIVDILIKYGADINDNIGGWTALRSAACFGTLEILETLIDNGAYIDGQHDGSVSSALMLAAYKASADKVEALINAGANPLLKDADMNTAYMINEQVLKFDILEKRENMIEPRNKIRKLLIEAENRWRQDK
jgi:ankyrin repeat protein